MKKLFLLSSLFFLFACQELVKKPKNLVSKSKMSEIIAELALNDQTMLINTKGNMESGTRFILKKHNINPKDFSASFEYYTAHKQTLEILEDAQNIIKEKHPEGASYIEKKLEEIKNPPAQKEIQETPIKPLEIKRDTNQMRRPRFDRLQNPIRKKE